MNFVRVSSRVVIPSSTGRPQNLLTIGIKPHTPKPDPRHQLFCPLQFSVPSKDGLHKLPARIVAHVQLFTPTVSLRGLEHVFLANLQKLVESFPKTFARVEEIVDQFAVVATTDTGETLLGALDFTGKLDEGKPEVAGHFCDGCGRAVESDCPVVDPFSQTVCIEDTAEEKNGLFIRIPVLEVVACGYTSSSCIAIGGSGALRRWCLLLAGFRWWIARC